VSGKYISKAKATSFPFANDQYDHVHADPHFIAGCETYTEWLNSIPAADVVEVVRCRECENWDTDWKPTHVEEGQYFCPIIDRVTDKEFFCGNGERKDGGQDDGV
jgi:hypothetical protein